MLPTIASAITFLETQLEALDEKRARIVAALDGLRMLADGDEDPDTSRIDRRQTPRPSPPEPPQTNGAGLDDKVIAALKEGPLAPMHVSVRTGIKKEHLKRIAARLIADKKIRRTGSGPRNTQYQLV